MANFQQISGSELEIMQIIWSNRGSVLFSQITSELEKKSKTWKTNTVLTFLSRLVEKEMLVIKKRGRVNEYISLISESEYMADQTKTFLEKVYSGNAKNLVSSLLKQDYLTYNDFEELSKFWSGGAKVK
jgi:BlaI family penicillinase repressor